jgi:integral membrane protein (TIGR01906 family)
MRKKLDFAFVVVFSLFLIIGAIRFTIGFKELYYFDIDYLNIEQKIGLSKEEIKLNYDYIIDYNFDRKKTEFEMPTIKSSINGKIHFEEVRDIFINISNIFIILMIISLIGIYKNVKEKNFEFLKSTSKYIIIIPIILIIPVISNFDKAFVLMHNILFDNDYWIFDEKLDPVIKMLPEEFFFHAGIMILTIIILMSVICNIIYKKLNIKETPQKVESSV